MFTCDVCGGNQFHVDTISEVFEIDGRRVLVDNIPTQVCAQCGDMSFSSDTAEKVRRIVHGEAQSLGVVELELYEFA